MDKGVRNARRKSTDNDKIGRNKRAETTEKQAAKARQTERLIERLDVVEEPRKEWELRMEIAAAPRVRRGRRGAARRGGPPRRVHPRAGGPADRLGRRVAITGANGAGKSTLLAALLGRVEPDEGTPRSARACASARSTRRAPCSPATDALLGVFEAELPDWAAGRRSAPCSPSSASPPRTCLRPAASLSPGERTRAALALLQARGVNLLVLDEPTNHLDLPAIEQLGAALATYPGTLLLVTHDRRMLDTVHTNRHLHLTNGTITDNPT